MTKLTICLVTANRPKEFKEALLSVKNLNYKDFKLIIADDSANNESKIIAKKIFPDEIYFKNTPALGEILNSNKCISMAKSEWVCLFHDDDKLDPSYFDDLILQIEKNTDIDMAFTGRLMVNEEDRVFARQYLKDFKDSYIFKAEDILDYMLLGKKLDNYKVFINTSGLIFKKKIFLAADGFDSTIDTHCDTNLLLKTLAVSNKVLYVNKPLYINKIWFGYSGRTKSSERGVVFFAEKGVLDNFLIFCKKISRIKYTRLQNEIYMKFSLDAIAINGPLSWIGLRYKGSYRNKIVALLKTAVAMVNLNNKILIIPKFYFVLLSNLFMPKFINNIAHRFLLKYYYDR